MSDPEIEITLEEVVPGVTANAQALIAEADWKIEVADRTLRPWCEMKIPPYPSHEIEGPLMRCCCEGTQHPGHPEHTNLTNQEQVLVAEFLLRLEVSTPINWHLVRDWIKRRFCNTYPRFDKDRDPSLFYNEDAYSLHFKRYYNEEKVRQRTDAQVFAQAKEDHRSALARHEKWRQDVLRRQTLRDLIAKLPSNSPMRAQVAQDLSFTEFSVTSHEHFHSTDLPKLRSLEEQRVWELEECAKDLANLRKQVAEERQKVADAVPDFREFLAGLNPVDW